MNEKTLEQKAIERYGDYLKSQIADKEAEALRAEGELSALRSLYATFQQFTKEIR